MCEYYLCMVGDGQRLLMAEILLQVWSFWCKHRASFDMPLDTYQVCTPAEVLVASQGYYHQPNYAQ